MTAPHTQIVIIKEEEGTDVPWRAAYICETENTFWIVDYRGGVGKILWYGPFDASWDEANILVAIDAVISGAALIVVIVTRHTPKPLNAKA